MSENSSQQAVPNEGAASPRFTTSPPVVATTVGELIAALRDLPADAPMKFLYDCRCAANGPEVAVLGLAPDGSVHIDTEGDGTPEWGLNWAVGMTGQSATCPDCQVPPGRVHASGCPREVWTGDTTAVYVVRGCVAWEDSTVMAAFASRDEADAYVTEYQAHEFPERGPGYKANYDWYEVIPAEVGVKPFDLDDLAQRRESAR